MNTRIHLHSSKKPIEEKNNGEWTDFIDGYGRFPYLILWPSSDIYSMQIPIHFLREGEELDSRTHPGTALHNVEEEILSLPKEEQIAALHDRLMELSAWILEKIEADRGRGGGLLYLVEGENLAYVIGEPKLSISWIPSGGTLVTQGLRLLAQNSPHYIKEVENDS